jgi:hypothetical protein
MAVVRGWLPFDCCAYLNAVQGWLACCSVGWLLSVVVWLAAVRGRLADSCVWLAG